MDIENRIKELTGPLFASMTNDLLFRAFMQSDENSLKGLISALLKIKFEDIKKLEITNPIVFGKSIFNKEYKLDLRLLLNDYSIINVELQVTNEKNWPERSLSYLCRNYDNLNRGDDYVKAKPAIHIGILDYTLFPDHPEFYASYMMLNTRNYYPYTDKFVMHVLDITKIEMASADDKRYGIDKWALLFKAKTWEELKMVAEQNKFMDKAVVTIAKLSEDEIMRQEIEAHEEFLRIKRTQEIWYAMEKDKFERAKSDLADAKADLDTAKADLNIAKATIAELNAEIERLKKADK